MQHHDQTYVHATPRTVVARLPSRLSLGDSEVALDPHWDVDASDGSCRTRASWRGGRRHGSGVLEVRPAGWGWSELALSWRGTADRPPQLGAYVEDRTPAPAPGPRRSPAPRRAVLATAAALAVVGAVVGAAVVLPVGGVTPVTADAALTEFRSATSASAPSTATGPAPPPPAPAPPSGDDVASEPTDVPDVAAPTSTATAGAGPSGTSAATPGPDGAGIDADTHAPPDTAPDRPAAGVYRYATDGSEELDVRGSHRRFPAETAQVIAHTDCGYRQVWEPLEERRDELGFCVGTDPAALVTMSTARSFFGQRRAQAFTCAPVATTDDGWSTRCDDDDGTTMTVTTQQLGAERLTVAGEAVEVTRLRVVADLAGQTSGQRRSTVWNRTEDGLLVRAEVASELEAPGPFGRVDYQERYELDLLDLEPRT